MGARRLERAGGPAAAGIGNSDFARIEASLRHELGCIVPTNKKSGTICKPS